MKVIFTFIFGFIIGAGVGFKILEGVSTQLLVEAWDNSYTEFKASYSGSLAQKTLDRKVQEQKAILIKNIQDGIKDKLMTMFYLDKAAKKEPLIPQRTINTN